MKILHSYKYSDSLLLIGWETLIMYVICYVFRLLCQCTKCYGHCQAYYNYNYPFHLLSHFCSGFQINNPSEVDKGPNNSIAFSDGLYTVISYFVSLFQLLNQILRHDIRRAIDVL